MTATPFSKLHATGNDFLVHVRGTDDAPLDEGAAAALCDRHRGVGADGLISFAPTDRPGTVEMVLWNSDGGQAEMSGNGVRCLAWAAERAGLVDGDVLAVRTRAGEKHVTLQRDRTGAVTGASVDMGAVTFAPEAIPLAASSSLGLVAEFHGVRYEGDAVGMGNPHLVLFVDDPETARVTTHGPRLERDDRFPSRTNVEFVTVSADRAIEMRVWERGVGETLSCGTGACAAAAAAHRRGLVDERVRVRVRGGVLSVELGDSVVLGGPVRHVFDVVVDVARLVEQST